MANIVNGTSTGSGGLITTGDSSDELQLQTAEVARVTLTNTAVVVNESGADVDFRVEGDTEANLLFVDAGNDGVGIGTGTPVGRVRVKQKAGNGFTDGFSMQRSDTADTYEFVVGGDNSLYLGYANNASGADANADFTALLNITSSGNLVFPNGQGIDFSASAGGGATSSLLDDYEEGTWTPTDASGAGLTLTVGGTPGYVKIGRFVFFSVEVVTYPSTASGLTASVGGLPFTVDSINHGTLSFVASTANASAGLSVANSTRIFFYVNGTVSASTNANLSGATIYGISGCYQVP